MKTKLLITTAAAALLAAATFASAQTGGGGGGQGSGGAGGAGASQGGAASGAGSSGGGGAGGGAGSSTTDRGSGTMDRGSTTTQDRVQDNKAAPSQRTGQSQSPRNGTKNQAQDARDGDKAGQTERNGQRGQAGRQGAKENTGAAPSNAKVTTEQRTQIRQRLGSVSSARVTNVNFRVSVGVVVPTSVRVHPLPAEIVEIVPEYRGYDYILVEDEIVIIEPRTHKIVLVIT